MNNKIINHNIDLNIKYNDKIIKKIYFNIKYKNVKCKKH